MVAFALSGACAVVAACGSDDGKKTSPQPGNEQAGAESDGGGTSDGGEPNPSGSGGASPVTGEGGKGTTEPGAGGTSAQAGDASSGGDAPGGTSGATPGGAGAGGASDVGPLECPIGTADCDDDPNDCETNVASDAMNCGRCERACGATAACKSGVCDATVILQPNVQSNWCDAVFTPTTAYMLTCWGSFNEVRRAPLELGASVLGQRISTFTVAVTHARGMLIDDGKVLYGVQGNPSYIYQFPLDADGPEDVSVAYTFENGTRFNDLLLVGDTFYWNHNTHTAAGQIRPGEIRTRAKTGASSTTLVTGLGLNYDLQVFDTNMIWLETRTANDVNSVYRAPLAGAAIGDVELVVTAASGGYLVRHGDYAYWTTKVASPNGKLQRLLVDDPEAEVEDIATNLNLPEGLVADESYAYFKQLDALYRVPLEGGAPEQLSTVTPANNAQATQIFYVDDTYVYFAAGATGGASVVARVAK